MNYNFNFISNGEMAIISQLDVQDRELFIFKKFSNYASKKSKYIYKKHDVTLDYCISFITSGLYFKMLQIRDKLIKHNGVHYNNVEYEAYIRVMSQLKHAINKSEFLRAGTFINELRLPGVEVSFKDSNGDIYGWNIRGLYQESYIEGRTNKNTNTAMWDVFDIVTQWDNRHSRHQAKLNNAINELNDSLLDDNKNCFISSDYEKLDSEEKKQVNKKMRELSKLQNDIQKMTELNGNYKTPENVYFYNSNVMEAKTRINYIMTDNRKNMSRVLNILKSSNVMTENERQLLTRFRNRYDLFYRIEHINGTTEKIPLNKNDLYDLFIMGLHTVSY